MLESIRQHQVLRCSVVLAAVMAWFAVSNRCALAVAASPDRAAEIHRCCPQQPAPAEKAPEGKPSLCCKVLAVTVPDSGETVVVKAPLLVLPDFMATLADMPSTPVQILHRLDTGPPPEARPFVELVLQRSLPAHAPPCPR